MKIGRKVSGEGRHQRVIRTPSVVWETVLSSLPLANASGQTVCVLKMAACIRNGVFSAKQKYTERGPQKKRPRPGGSQYIDARERSKPWKRGGDLPDEGERKREGKREKATGSCRLTPFVTCRRKKERKEGRKSTRLSSSLFLPSNLIEIKISLFLSQCVFLLESKTFDIYMPAFMR